MRTSLRTSAVPGDGGTATALLVRERSAAALRSISGHKDASTARRLASASSIRATALRMSVLFASAVATSSFSVASLNERPPIRAHRRNGTGQRARTRDRRSEDPSPAADSRGRPCSPRERVRRRARDSPSAPWSTFMLRTPVFALGAALRAHVAASFAGAPGIRRRLPLPALSPVPSARQQHEEQRNEDGGDEGRDEHAAEHAGAHRLPRRRAGARRRAASGSTPSTNASDVITIGRKRSRAASSAASHWATVPWPAPARRIRRSGSRSSPRGRSAPRRPIWK